MCRQTLLRALTDPAGAGRPRDVAEHRPGRARGRRPGVPLPRRPPDRPGPHARGLPVPHPHPRGRPGRDGERPPRPRRAWSPACWAQSPSSSGSRRRHSSAAALVTGPGAGRSRSSQAETPCTSRVVEVRNTSLACATTSIGSSTSTPPNHSRTSARVTPGQAAARQRRRAQLPVDHVEDVGPGALAQVAGQVGEDRLARAASVRLGQGDDVLGVRRGLEAGQRAALVAGPRHGRDRRGRRATAPWRRRPRPGSAARPRGRSPAGPGRRCR